MACRVLGEKDESRTYPSWSGFRGSGALFSPVTPPVWKSMVAVFSCRITSLRVRPLPSLPRDARAWRASLCALPPCVSPLSLACSGAVPSWALCWQRRKASGCQRGRVSPESVRSSWGDYSVNDVVTHRSGGARRRARAPNALVISDDANIAPPDDARMTERASLIKRGERRYPHSGMQMMTVVPIPCVESMAILPACASTIVRAMASPRPDPERLRLASPR